MKIIIIRLCRKEFMYLFKNRTIFMTQHKTYSNFPPKVSLPQNDKDIHVRIKEYASNDTWGLC